MATKVELEQQTEELKHTMQAMQRDYQERMQQATDASNAMRKQLHEKEKDVARQRERLSQLFDDLREIAEGVDSKATENALRQLAQTLVYIREDL